MVIAWDHVSEEMIKKYERNEQLRCMDYINFKNQKKLYVGTNRGVILTIDITAELQLEIIKHDDYDMEMDMDYMGEDVQIDSSTKKGKVKYED